MNQEQPIRVKRFLIHCEPCGFKKIVDQDTDVKLHEFKIADIPGGSPKFNPANNKLNLPKSISRNKGYKCPKCGRGVISRTLPDVYKNAILQRDNQTEQEEIQRRREQRIKDGQLPEKPYFDPKNEIEKRKKR